MADRSPSIDTIDTIERKVPVAGLNTLNDLFVKELRDIYDAEKQLTKALPKLAKAASAGELSSAFEAHLEQTRGHISRLEQVFEQLELKARGQHCPGIAGIIEEGSELIGEDGEDAVKDAALIGAAQRAEHYEITAYGTLMAYARQLGHDDIVNLLEETLNEEKDTDRKLTELAVSHFNALAAQEPESDGMEEDEETGSKPKTMTAGRARR
jgi:ferritin-like metal-binding protein YciE